MPELPQKKVGIIACSGEELAEGTVTRLAALKVLEKLRPGDTVTICLPLFLAGGESDRAFAKYYPTIAVDGCEKRCAFKGTEMYSNRPAASLVISQLVDQNGLGVLAGRRELNPAGMQTVDAAAAEISTRVDDLLGKAWSRRAGKFNAGEPAETVATCACGSGIPVQKVWIGGRELTLVALPLIFQNFWEDKKAPSPAVAAELMDMVKIYNQVEAAEEAEVRQAVEQEYRAYCRSQGANA